MAQEPDPLEIPAWLLRGTPENAAALAAGAERLAQQKTEGAPRHRAPPDDRKREPTKIQAAALAKLGWTPRHVARISRADAAVYIETRLGPECRFPPSKEAQWDTSDE